LVDFVAHDKGALLLFSNAGTKQGCLAFLASINNIVTNTVIQSYKDPPCIDWIVHLSDVCSAQHSTILKYLKQANDDCKKQLGYCKSAKKRFSQSLGFTTRPCTTSATKLTNLPKTFLKRFTNKKVYPPLKTWVYKTPVIGKQCRRHLKYGQQPDKQRYCLLMMQVNT
ncbi:hypothetical protein K443DRAFT_94497, partial [Laccaria amethystina LaAM-08-1]